MAVLLFSLLLASILLSTSHQQEEEQLPYYFGTGDDFVQRLRDTPYNARAVPMKELRKVHKPRMPLLRF